MYLVSEDGRYVTFNTRVADGGALLVANARVLLSLRARACRRSIPATFGARMPISIRECLARLRDRPVSSQNSSGIRPLSFFDAATF